MDLLKAVWGRFSSRRGSTLAAAIGYRAIFALAPLLVVGVSGAGLVFGEQAAQGLLTGDLVRVLGQRLAEDIESLLASARDQSGAGVIGTLVLIWAGSGLFNELQGATAQIYGLTPPPGVRNAVGRRLVTLAAVVLMVIGLALVAAMAVWIPLTGSLLASLGTGAVLLAAVAVGFRHLTSFRPHWGQTTLAAAATILTMAVATTAVGFFVSLGRGTVTGIAGSAVAVLLLVYALSAVFLIGAAFLRELGLRGGPRASRRPAGAL